MKYSKDIIATAYYRNGKLEYATEHTRSDFVRSFFHYFAEVVDIESEDTWSIDLCNEDVLEDIFMAGGPMVGIYSESHYNEIVIHCTAEALEYAMNDDRYKHYVSVVDDEYKFAADLNVSGNDRYISYMHKPDPEIDDSDLPF